ncbi:MAG: leucyl aminopeptidase [Bacteroidales bacterium]|nr:leucyl aminopeptidase [Bacteroidales bacterium]
MISHRVKINVYIIDKYTKLSEKEFSKQEIIFINSKLKKEKEIISLSDFKTFKEVVVSDPITSFDSVVIDKVRKTAAKIFKKTQGRKIKNLVVKDMTETQILCLPFTDGFALAAYRFDKYFTKKEEEKSTVEQISLISRQADDAMLERMQTVIRAVYYARDLVNEPVSFLTAKEFANQMKQMGQEAGFHVEVFGKKKIESLKMGGLLAVNKGSFDEPTFTIMEWKPKDAINKKPFVFVGKGVVFDTGGLSLKPTAGSMDEMKCDMAGGAAVAGSMYAIAKNKLRVWVIGLVPATDNRPGNKAYAPQDVVTMHNGMTVEVLNTDAEGRMLLADALSYAKKYNPEVVIDLATLTGSAHAAIGPNAIVGMTNDETGNFKELKEAGDFEHERIVEFPFWDEYAELLKSDVADMNNIGGKVAGAITAGKFLEKFTDYPYIHLDIAGPAYLTKSDGYNPVGGTGVGVRLLYKFLQSKVLENDKK